MNFLKKLIISVMTILLSLFPFKSYANSPTPLYTQQEIEYFTEIAIGSEFGNSDKVIYKWEDDIKIKVTGKPSVENMITLHKVVTELNELIGDKIKLSLVYDNEDSNVEIYFGKLYEFSNKTSNYVSGNWGFFETYSSWRGIFESLILISTDMPNDTEIKHMILEETVQQLGLMQDSHRYYDSIFQQSWTTTTELSELDKKLIQMLYLDEIKHGMSKDEVISVFNKLNKENELKVN